MAKARVTITTEIDPKRFAVKIKRLVEKYRIDLPVLAEVINDSKLDGTGHKYGPLQMPLLFEGNDCLQRIFALDIERVIDALTQLGVTIILKDLL